MHVVLAFLILSFSFFISEKSFSTTRSESIVAATTIGKWLTKITGHYDFLSATPVAVKRAGKKFMITKQPAKQFASDYGYSYMQSSFSEDVLSAYSLLNVDTSLFPESLELNRFHLNLGMENMYDLTFSYTMASGGIKGYAIGFKRQLIRKNIFSLAFRSQMSKAHVENYFDSYAFTNDLSIGFYFRLIDFFIGVKHTMGVVNFDSDIEALEIPSINFISNFQELEYFYGIVLSTSLNSRLTFQMNNFQNEKTISGKFSLHFDSLFPTNIKTWFRDARYIKY